jgi:hypothetical protein
VSARRRRALAPSPALSSSSTVSPDRGCGAGVTCAAASAAGVERADVKWANAARSAARISRALSKRSRGDLLSARRQTASSPGSTAVICEGGSGGSVMCFIATKYALSPSNGGRPTSM